MTTIRHMIAQAFRRLDCWLHGHDPRDIRRPNGTVAASICVVCGKTGRASHAR